MKIRKGFVSNSSSSSFCIYGCSVPDEVTPEDALEMIKMSEGLHDRLDKRIAPLKKRDNDYCRNLIKVYETLKRLDDPDVFAESNMKEKIMAEISDMDTFWSLMGLESHHTEYSSYIGRSWSYIGDDETGKEFKESVEKALRIINKGEDAIKCSTIEEAWYDG